MRTVMKFGGSVLENAQDFRRLARVVAARRRKGEEILVVNSALSGVTDQLIAAAAKAAKSRKGVKAFVEGLRQRHRTALAGVEDPGIRAPCLEDLEQGLRRLERALRKMNAGHGRSPHAADLVHSFGERLAARLIAAHLSEAGIPAKAYDADEAGLVVEGNGAGPHPVMPLVKKNFRKIAARLGKEVPVVTGYFGADRKRRPVCLGRGGTDYSAAILANAVDADRLELWKDVGDFYSADPKRVPGARPLAELSYDEAEELSGFGAKILHPKTIGPLREKGIEAFIRSVREPGKAGTRIHAAPKKTGHQVKAVAMRKDVALASVRSASMVGMRGVLAKVFGAVSDAGVSVDFVSTSEAGITFSVDAQDQDKTRKALQGLYAGKSGSVEVENGLALVGVIGEAIKSTPGVVGRVGTCLGKADINIEAVSMGSSEIDVMLLVKEEDAEAAVRCLHKALVEGRT